MAFLAGLGGALAGGAGAAGAAGSAASAGSALSSLSGGGSVLGTMLTNQMLKPKGDSSNHPQYFNSLSVGPPPQLGGYLNYGAPPLYPFQPFEFLSRRRGLTSPSYFFGQDKNTLYR